MGESGTISKWQRVNVPARSRGIMDFNNSYRDKTTKVRHRLFFLAPSGAGSARFGCLKEKKYTVAVGCWVCCFHICMYSLCRQRGGWCPAQAFVFCTDLVACCRTRCHGRSAERLPVTRLMLHWVCCYMFSITLHNLHPLRFQRLQNTFMFTITGTQVQWYFTFAKYTFIAFFQSLNSEL